MNLPKERKLTLEECKRKADMLRKRFEGPRGLHERVRRRTLHMFLDPSVDPQMPGSVMKQDGWEGPLQNSAVQKTRVKQINARLKARVCENPWKIECTPIKDTIGGRGLANDAETLLMQGFDHIQQQTGLDIQGNLYDGLAWKAVGILHWRIDTSVWDDDMPDYDEADELPECEMCEGTGKAAGEKCPECRGRGYTGNRDYVEDDYADGRTKGKKWRESDESVKERIARYKAECGFPVYLETLDPSQCFWIQDKSTLSEFKEFMVARVISLGDWKDEKRAALEKREALRERDAPASNVQGSIDHWMPESTDYEREVTLYQYWTRRHWYEWVDGDDDAFDAGEHHYGMPPFAFSLGRYNDVASPAWAYLPALDAMLEEKPEFDRVRSIMNWGIEQSAIQQHFLQQKAGVTPVFQDGDQNIALNPTAGAAETIPNGMELVTVGGNGMNAQFERLYEYTAKDMQEAEPGTGFATFGASTQPWSARQERDQENMEPKQYITSIARCLQVMVNNLIRCFADEENGPGEVFGYAKIGDTGKLDRTKVVSMKPKDWENVIADVSIQEVGSLERASLMETGLILLEKGVITLVEYFTEYMGVPNGEKKYAQLKVFQMWEKEILPGMLRQSAAEYLGPQYAIAPDGVPVGMDGRAVTDEQVIQANGGTPLVQQPQMAPGGMGATPPAMAPLNAPGTPQLAGTGGMM